MSKELYPYQVQTIDEVRVSFMSNLRTIMCAPTGAGKTVMFSEIIERSVKKGTLTLVLTDRLELFEQSVESIQSLGIPVCKIDQANKSTPHAALMYVGMVQTVLRRIEQLKNIPFKLIICDECHSAIFNRIFDTWPNTKVIGATATPIGKHLYKYYTKLVSCVDTPDLVRDGFLSPCKSYQMQDDLSDIELKKNGDYNDNSMYKHYNNTKLYDGVITEYLAKTKGKKAIVFNINVSHTIQMTAAFNSIGIKSFCVTSKTPKKERDWILKEFERGAFPVLNNCGILTKGYNCPSIEVVIINRATKSTALFLQMLGRGSRIFPGKTHFTTLDFGMNHDLHGLYDEPRKWSLEPPKKKRAGLGAAPVKSCPNCEAMLPAMARVCQYCNHIFLPTEKELAQGRMVELTNKIRAAIPGRYVSQLTIPELIECEKAGELKPAYVWRVLRSRGAMAVGEYARLKEYRDAWVVRQLEAIDHELNDGKPTMFFDKKINEVALITQ